MVSLALISVSGMTCDECGNAIIKGLYKLNAVNEVNISVINGECKVVFDGDRIQVDDLIEVIKDCGFGATVTHIDGIIQSRNTHEGVIKVIIKFDYLVSEKVWKDFKWIIIQMGGITVREERRLESLYVECNSIADVGAIEQKLKDAEIVNFKIVPLEVLKFEDSLVGDDKTSTGLKEVSISIGGMSCGACSLGIENTVSKLEGVEYVSVSLMSNEAKIRFNESQIGVRALIDAIEGCGFDAELITDMVHEKRLKILNKTKELCFWKWCCIESSLVSCLLGCEYVLIPHIFPSMLKRFPYLETGISGLFYCDIIGLLLTTVLNLRVGPYFYKSFKSSIINRTGTMNTLIFVSIMITYAFSVFSMGRNIVLRKRTFPSVFFETSASLFAFVSGGKYMESIVKSHSLNALMNFESFLPSVCTIVDENGDSREIDVHLLQVGDIIELKPGAKVPADCIVIKGESEIDESLLTGESMLVAKKPRATLICGSINGPGYLLCRATVVGDNTRLARVVSTMKKAQLQKPRIQRYADMLASKFVLVIFALALLTFFGWLLVFYVLKLSPSILLNDEPFYTCLKISLSVIVVACPCALGLASPTAIMVGTSIGASNGVLFKGGDVIEKITKLNAFLFDKTGTLTTKNISVASFTPFDPAFEITNTFWKLVNTAEQITEHPIADALVKYSSKFIGSSLNDATILKQEIIIGKGVICTILLNDREYEVIIGSRHLMPVPVNHKIDITNSMVAIDGKVIGFFRLISTLKHDAYEVVNYLISRGYYVGMVTGDKVSPAMKIANQLGIPQDNVYSEISPNQKGLIVQHLKQNMGYNISFIGDGINDSVALALSDVGISFTTSTELVLEASEVILQENSFTKETTLKKIIYAMDIAQKTYRRLQLNLFWAFVYNFFMIPISMGILSPWNIYLTPISASIGMCLSSISVVTCSLLLNRWKPPKLSASTITRNKTGIRNWLHNLRKSKNIKDTELWGGLFENMS